MTPPTHIRMLESWLLHFQFSFLLMVLGKQWKTARITAFWPRMWETRLEFLADGFTLAQTHLLQCFNARSLFLSPFPHPPSLSVK